MFNVTNRANFTNPASGNRRVQADFLRLSGLMGGTGFRVRRNWDEARLLVVAGLTSDT